jgi:phosphatidate cytidylyltransferase
MPVGVAACVVAPLAAYWMGDAVLPLIVVFALIGCGIVFVAGDSIDISPTPQMAVTLFGIMWIGLFGSFASLILRLSTTGSFAGSNIGTDTLFIVVIGVIANDIAAYFVGSAVGRTPLRDWISPNKSTEGLIGGTLGTLGAVIIVGLQSTTWNGLGEWLALAIVIALVAPLGDLVESMIKRNLGVKDFGTILTGHGGVLDRFDSMLFTLPVVYYLALVLQPWG